MSRDGNNSTRKLAIIPVLKADGTTWIDVVLLKYGERTRFRPSFHDLFRIIRAIGWCEDLKYPPPARGRWMIADFVNDTLRQSKADYPALARKYHIPERDGDEIVRTNGAHGKIVTPLSVDDIKW